LASTFLLHGAVQYGFGFMALLGIGMGIAGVVFFDRNKPDTSNTTKPSSSGKKSDERLGYETYRATTTTCTDGSVTAKTKEELASTKSD